MSEEIEVKKKVATKKTAKVKQVEQPISLQGKEILLSEIDETKRNDICLEIQKWKNGGTLDAHRYARIMRILVFSVKGLPRGRELAIKFASELNALGNLLECKTVKGKSCCG